MSTESPSATINTQHGDADIKIHKNIDTDMASLYCFMPPCGGAGIFMQFYPGTLIANALECMRQAINLGPHEENQNLLEHFNFRNCAAVGTGESVTKQVKSAVLSDDHPLKGLLSQTRQ